VNSCDFSNNSVKLGSIAILAVP